MEYKLYTDRHLTEFDTEITQEEFDALNDSYANREPVEIKNRHLIVNDMIISIKHGQIHLWVG